jgi:N6-L-threonylcarbamoyladenine synthase
VINQIEQFRKKGVPGTLSPQDIAACFQKTAIDILYNALMNAVTLSGLTTIVAGGGVAANSYLRAKLASNTGIHCIFPPLELCGDNAAMVAGIAYQYALRGETSPWSTIPQARIDEFKHKA